MNVRRIASRAGLLGFIAAVLLVGTLAHGQVVYLNAFGGYGAGNGQLNGAVGLAVSSAGSVYVADNFNNRVEVFSSTGAFQQTIGSSGSGNGQLNIPKDVAVSSDGSVYVADATNSRVEVFNAAGAFKQTIGSFGSGNGQLNTPQGLAVSSAGLVYVADTDNNRVEVFNAAGAFVQTIGSSGAGNGQLANPNRVDVSSAGNVYVADTGNARVEVFGSNGAYLQTIGSLGTGNGQFQYVSDVAYSGNGRIYATDTSLNRVEVFNSAGTYQATFGSAGSGAGQFQGLFGIAVGTNGIVYACDFTANTISRFFDPSAWTNGAVTFTDATVGPTSVGLGVTGGTINVNSSMGLTAAGNVTINSSSTLNLNGGSINAQGILEVTGTLNCVSGQLAGGILEVDGGARLALPAGQAAYFTSPGITSGFLTYYNQISTSGLMTLSNSSALFTGQMSNRGTIEGIGSLSFSAGLFNYSVLALAGNSSVTGAVTNQSGGVIHLSGTVPTLFFDPVTNSTGGSISVDAGAAGVFYGTYSGAGSIVNNGTLFLNATSVAGKVTGTGTLTIGIPSGPAVLQASGSVVAQNSVVLAGGSTLDLGSAGLILHATPLATVTAEVASAYAGGTWTGPGITSSLAAADTKHLTAVGVIQNVAANGTSAVYTSFDGQSVISSDVLARNTYYGDANLSGNVDGSDYTLIDYGFNKHLTGWYNGDFNYDGVISGSDYTLIDNAFNTQGAALTAEVASSTAVIVPGVTSAVPEPASLSLVAIGGLALLRRRRHTPDVIG